VSLTASFRGSKLRNKIIREKSKIYKYSQNAIKIKKSLNYLQKKCLVMRIGWKMHYLQPITWFYDFFLRQTKIFQKFIKQKNTCLMILNEKPNCQVSRILMNPRPILSDSSENDPLTKNHSINKRRDFDGQNFDWSEKIEFFQSVSLLFLLVPQKAKI
jgi:hypothetical protein